MAVATHLRTNANTAALRNAGSLNATQYMLSTGRRVQQATASSDTSLGTKANCADASTLVNGTKALLRQGSATIADAGVVITIGCKTPTADMLLNSHLWDVQVTYNSSTDTWDCEYVLNKDFNSEHILMGVPATTMSALSVVYVDSSGVVTLYDNTDTSLDYKAIGLLLVNVTEIDPTAAGYTPAIVCMGGTLEYIEPSATILTKGDTLWADTAGGLVTTRPTTGQNVRVGEVIADNFVYVNPYVAPRPKLSAAVSLNSGDTYDITLPITKADTTWYGRFDCFDASGDPVSYSLTNKTTGGITVVPAGRCTLYYEIEL